MLCVGLGARAKAGQNLGRIFPLETPLLGCWLVQSCKVEVRITGRDGRGATDCPLSIGVSCVGCSQKTQRLHPPRGPGGATYRVSTTGREVLAR